MAADSELLLQKFRESGRGTTAAHWKKIGKAQPTTASRSTEGGGRCGPRVLMMWSEKNEERSERRQREEQVRSTMDTFFVSHGSPGVAIDDTIPARRFFQSWGFPPAPRAILVVSAHWETAAPAVSVVHGTNPTIRNYLGVTQFPELMYQIEYTAPGAPELAKKTKALLEQAGLGPVEEHHGRGLDIGAWPPLMLMYPAADVPVCQLSVQPARDAAHHHALGRALAPLRDDGVLVLGSGGATPRGGVQGEPPPDWAAQFDAWLRDALLDGRYADVRRYREAAPHAELAHPRPEHIYPLHVALGAAGDGARAELIHQSWVGSLSYASYRFSTTD